MPVKSFKNPRQRFFKNRDKSYEQNDSPRLQPINGVAKVPVRELEPKRVLNAGRRKQLEEIASREKSRATRDKLAYILIEKLSLKYSHIHKSIISTNVIRFVSANKEITGDDIVELEKSIVDAAANSKKMSSNNYHSNYGNSSNSEQVSSSSSADVAVKEESLPKEPPAGSEWTVIQTYQALVAEEKHKQEQQQAINKKIQFRKILDEQIRQRTSTAAVGGTRGGRSYKNRGYKSNNATSSDNESSSSNSINQYDAVFDEKSYAQYLSEDVKKFYEEEEKKRLNIDKKHHDELMQRKEQIMDAERRKNDEKESLRLFEENNLKLAQMKIKEDNDKLFKRKLEQQENLARIEKENEHNRLLREAEKAKESEHDQLLMRQYAAKLDKDAFDRENAFKNRMDSMSAFASKYESEGAGKKLREEKIRMEQQLLKEQKLKEDSDAYKEAKKIQDAKDRIQLASVVNENLLRQRQEKEDLDRQKDLEYAQYYQKEGELYKKEVLEKRLRQKEQQENYRKMLSSQMQQQRTAHHTNKYGMEEREKELNKTVLKKVVEDKEMFSKILHRVRMGGARTSTAPGKM